MHLRLIVITNICCISSLRWVLPPQKGSPGWHVIIGDNGSGKSSFLRSVALALIGPDEIQNLKKDWKSWIRDESQPATVIIAFDQHPGYDHWAGGGSLLKKGFLRASLSLRVKDGEAQISPVRVTPPPRRHIWSNKVGWFSAAYGPFRRFSGSDPGYEKIIYQNPKLSRHLTVFGENIALTECLEWLKQLHRQSLENNKGTKAKQLLESVIRFVNNSNILPHNVKIEMVSSKHVRFIDGNGFKVSADNLSDGYRSILSMTFELIRQMTQTFDHGSIFNKDNPAQIKVPAVVLIDEVDAHLHPTWQRRIGAWFCEHFPDTQFIVTTHSPLVCQAAAVGSVFRLPSPGTEDEGTMLEGPELDRLVFGNVLEAFSTEAFGKGITRSDQSKVLLNRLAQINQKERYEKLSQAEMEEQGRLRSIFLTQPDPPPVERTK